jgi:SAM-dependent methyltransferase
MNMPIPDEMAATVPSEESRSPYRLKADRWSSHGQILRRLGGDGRGRHVLDVGTASGYLARLLSERGFRVTGIEADAELARQAASSCDRVILANLDEPLPELGGPFDAIIYADVLEHLRQPSDVLKNINGYLKHDGMVIISLPNVAHLWVRLQLLLGRFDYADRGILDRTHLRFFTLKTFRDFLLEADLEAVEIIATPVPLPLVVPERMQGRIFDAVHRFSARLANSWKTMFGYQFVAVARKRINSEA